MGVVVHTTGANVTCGPDVSLAAFRNRGMSTLTTKLDQIEAPKCTETDLKKSQICAI